MSAVVRPKQKNTIRRPNSDSNSKTSKLRKSPILHFHDHKMNPNKIESDDLFFHNPNPHLLHHTQDFHLHQPPPPPSVSDPTFSEMSLSSSPSSSDPEEDDSLPQPNPQFTTNANPNPNSTLNHQIPIISPEPHISTQFYTFNPQSHSLMIRCLLENRVATSDEIRQVTPRQVLKSWRSVWKDRNEDTAYLTAWKRILEKLNARLDGNGNEVLFFKNNVNQFVPHVNQWNEIVASCHSDSDLKHFGLKETVDRIKQMWAVGAKFYGIPESYVRVFVSACVVCNNGDGASGGMNKRKRFEYTESFDVPAKEGAT